MAQDDAHAVTERFEIFSQAQQMKDVVSVDHHAIQHCEFRNGPSDQIDVWAKQLAIEGLWFDGSATKHRAF